ncbi:MAG: hypothetical protein EXR75_16930 [Myxococcales bacterium]|nr:hypothetical protein [Myxococcales bacterium]
MLAAAAGAIAAVALVLVMAFAAREARQPNRCARGMQMLGNRCCGEGQGLDRDRCVGVPRTCAVSMRVTDEGCVPELTRILIPGGAVERMPIDWDAPAVREPMIAVQSFLIDSHEVTVGAWAECIAARECVTPSEGCTGPVGGEPGMPQGCVTAAEAASYCQFRGGSLPTRDQLAFAAMGIEGRRYPWGNAGAVCRRVAFAVVEGPCAHDATTPDLAGSHPEGQTPEGVHDLAGNVEEWTAPEGAGLAALSAEVSGGSFRDASATALRTFHRRRVSIETRSFSIGLRCVYAVE